MRQSGVISKYSATESAEVLFLRFSTFTKDELERWSVAQINETRLYDVNGIKPTTGAPNDLRLGVSTPDQVCQTCGESRECQGHFGHIKLAEPVFHYGYMQYVQKILKCICHNCSRLKILQNQAQLQKFNRIKHISQPTKRLNELAKLLSSINRCTAQESDKDSGTEAYVGGCGAPIPTKISYKGHAITVESKEEVAGDQLDKDIKPKKRYITLTGARVRNIFTKISISDYKILGFTATRPIDLLIETLAVAPPQIRPSIEMNPQKKAEDQITSAYVRIISINNEIKSFSDTISRDSKIAQMEKLVNSIMVKVDKVNLSKNSGPGAGGKKKKVMKKIKSIEERLKSKEGRFRQHLMGKRVDFSARSVVSPDSSLALDELGVPEKIAASLTIPQQVNEINYNRMIELCKQGKVKFIVKPSQDRKKQEQIVNLIKIHDRPEQIQKFISYGTIVERQLQNGDFVIFNRQPTLHRMSMMGHRVRILPYNTFRLNLSVCTPYNADFDGDQMNMHVPQSYETTAELKHIAHVPKQIIAPKSNSPVMGIVQDSLLGIYLFTMRDTFLTREEAMNLVIWIESKEGKGQGNSQLLPGQLPMPAILKPEPLWTGKQIMSMIIPEKITIEMWKGKDGLRNAEDNSMLIRKGDLLSGALQKEVVGSGAGGLVHSIWLQIGPDATNQFVTTAQRIVNNWLITNSFTVGAADCVPDEQIERNVQEQIVDINKQYYVTLNKYRNQKVIGLQNLHQRGKKVADSFEYNINATLNNKLSVMQNIVAKNVSPYLNSIYKMITAKSKGSETNLTQILFCLGNQNVDGKRCPLGFSRRALPHFSKDDNSPESRGFVFSSFYKGLKPHEFFFHSMGGREGLSDTAVKTSRTGYIQRKLVKSLEDLVVQYDGTVRDSQKNMLQKIYGEDSFSAEYIEKHKLADAELSEEKFRQKYGWDRRDLEHKWKYDEGKIRKLNEQVQILNKCRMRLRDIFIVNRETIEVEYYAPITISRLINKIQAITREKNPEIVNPHFVYVQVEKLINDCVTPNCRFEYGQLLAKYAGVEKESKKNQFFKKKRQFQQQNGLEMFRIHIRMFLASKKICQIDKISEKCFIGLIEEIRDKFHQSLAPAGEAIGSVAAQSIGEPTTQMTLNTFHLAGVSDRNVTLGVPRLQQLLDASKNIKTPNTTIYYFKPLLQANRNTEEVTKILASVISFDFPERHIRDFLHSSRIYYDMVTREEQLPLPGEQFAPKSNTTPWVLSLVFDKKKLTSKEPWNQIMHYLDKIFSENFEIVEKVGFGEDDPPEILLRGLESIQGEVLPKIKNERNTMFEYLHDVDEKIRNIFTSGIKGIKTVKTSKKVVMTASYKEELNKKKKQSCEYIIFEAEGTNLRACLTHPKIDPIKTYSNDISEIFNVLGIEAARTAFMNQFKDILKPYSIYINHRHLSILADWMATRGFLTAINRNGINRVRDVSILRKASFEETTDVLFGAAVFSQYDMLRGVSERIIFGQNVKIGTHSFEVMIDRDMVGDVSLKPARDRIQEADEKAEGQVVDFGDISKTPVNIGTPMVRFGGGGSIRGGDSSLRLPMMSPTWKTPVYGPSQRQFSEHQMDDFVGQSPLPSQTPFIYNTNATPLINRQTESPFYNNSSYHHNSRPSSSQIRSPSYLYQNSGSISPNYSSLQSRSPDYNSPLGSSGRMGNSPNYSPSPMDPHRGQFKAEEQNDEDEDDEA